MSLRRSVLKDARNGLLGTAPMEDNGVGCGLNLHLCGEEAVQFARNRAGVIYCRR
jgi:hypothetical protein